jgi:hypothetical protein
MADHDRDKAIHVPRAELREGIALKAAHESLIRSMRWGTQQAVAGPGSNCSAEIGARSILPSPEHQCDWTLTTASPNLCDDGCPIDCGSSVRVSVLQRLMALLVLWAGLLGVGSQALACVTSAPADDCCPPGVPSPCGDPGTSGSTPTTICCVVAPTPDSIVASNVCQPEAKRSFGSPGPLGPPTATAQATSACRVAIPTLSHSPLHSDARLTYLRTGRLRL